MKSFRSSQIRIEVLSIGAFLGLLIAVFWIHEANPYPHAFALLPVFSALVLIATAHRSVLVRLLLTNRLLVWLGLLSYSLYLWHWPIFSFLHISEGDTPHRDARMLAIVLSIALAWGTFRFVERPVQKFGRGRALVSLSLVGVMLCLSFTAIQTQQAIQENRSWPRELYFRSGLEHKIGDSFAWFEGDKDWLFLGNAWDKHVEKLKLENPPAAEDIFSVTDPLSRLVDAASSAGSDVLLLVGPNKSSVYPEYLPPEVTPARDRYLSYFWSDLSKINNQRFIVGFFDDFPSGLDQNSKEYVVENIKNIPDQFVLIDLPTDEGIFTIPNDGHPTYYYNQQLTKILNDNIKFKF